MRHLVWSFGWVTLAAIGACSGDEPDQRVKVEASPAMPGFQVDDSSLAEDGPATSEDAPSCQTEVRAAEAIGLDLYVMLDSSGSMNAEVPSDAVLPTTKWDAVRSSLRAFVDAPETQGIGVGLQFFPQIKEGVAPLCATDDECGPAGGLCGNRICTEIITEPQDNGPDLRAIVPAGDAAVTCLANDECGRGETCRQLFGFCVVPPLAFPDVPEGILTTALCQDDTDCAGLPGSLCDRFGLCDISGNICTGAFPCPAEEGECFVPPGTCSEHTRCAVADYATPAVPITSDATRAAQIRRALALRAPDGLTPTGPALQGALEHAQVWAEQHPERQVVTVLATDGIPEGFCKPDQVSDIAELAADANTGPTPIRTFVIGVFADQDVRLARENLDAIARAGGSEEAIVISTSNDVTEEFLGALNRIRNTAVSCEFQLTGVGLDFEKVNLEVVEASGTTQLFNVGGASACGNDEQGWYYERDAAGSPTQITVCPSTCTRFNAGNVTANLQIGCATRIR